MNGNGNICYRSRENIFVGEALETVKVL